MFSFQVVAVHTLFLSITSEEVDFENDSYALVSVLQLQTFARASTYPERADFKRLPNAVKKSRGEEKGDRRSRRRHQIVAIPTGSYLRLEVLILRSGKIASRVCEMHYM